MSVFSRIAGPGHEQVLHCTDARSGFRLIIAIHDTTLGPALGGCRMWNYATEEEALTDVLRLSQGMTYKASLAGLDLGGGKSVILLPASPLTRESRERLFGWFGRMVDSLNGRYITAEDVGTSVEDMMTAARHTRHVVGRSLANGGSGDPSPLTAWGVFCGIKACLREAFGDESLKGRRVAIQGVGKVGMPLARLLAEAGARLLVTDRDPKLVAAAVAEFKAEAVPQEGIFSVPCDILSPCALGGGLNDDTIPKLACRIVAGAANNQLLEPRHGKDLAARKILYAPDYCINAGGLINVDLERTPPYSPETARKKAAGVYDTLVTVFERARRESILPYEAAGRLAEERIGKARGKGTRTAAAAV